MIYPSNFEQKTGFDTIRTQLKATCLSVLGREKVDEIHFSDDIPQITEQIDCTMEFVSILNQEEELPELCFFDSREALRRIRIEGMYMDEQELFDLKRSLDTINNLVIFLRHGQNKETGTPYVNLLARAEQVITFPLFVDRISRILDLYGKMKDSASPNLQTIRHEKAQTLGGISHTLNGIIQSARQEGYIDKDVTPTLRDGRLVIPIAPAMKRKIRGIVHDESASGKTVFIEPAQVVEANNRIRALEGEEKREIIKILTDFSNSVRPHIEDMLRSYDFLAQIDFIRAKSLFAIRTKSAKPVICAEPIIDWVTAIHPLLEQTLTKHDKKTVPLDIALNNNKRILIISGPNAGGKSVCLKTVGLLQYMLQCGLPIPVREISKAGIFQHIFIDIGDEQSIEDDLSTYSSHLNNMKTMMRHCNARSLILIDEFGGGTEPQIGGALAEAILKRLNQTHTLGVITTHYQNLKHFAEVTEGVVNGAMLYDRQLMQPLYRMHMGSPGSSFAVEIARKIGLPEDVIADASEIVGSDYINADKYLQDIMRDKRYWETKRQKIHQQEKRMDQTISTYETEVERINKERKEIIQKAKEEAERLLQEANAKIENTIRAIKEAQAEKEKTQNVRKELDEFRKTLKSKEDQTQQERILKQMERIQNRQNRKKERKAVKAAVKPIKKDTEEKPLQEGDYVKIKGQSISGQIATIHSNQATVVFGQIKTTVNLARLERTNKKPATQKNETVVYVGGTTQEQMYQKKLAFKQDIDLRGMRGEEAIQTVTHFIDDAILVGMSRVRILHGTGNGILRTLIRQYLSTVPGVKHYSDEHIQMGGSGITVVDLE